MTHEDLSELLYEKAVAEQQKYRDWIHTLPTKEALDHAFEYVTREDILMTLEEYEPSDAQMRALLASPSPITDIFQTYAKMDSRHMEQVRDSIDQRADEMLSEQRSLPVYRQTGAYAREHNELEQFRASRKANIACKEAIEDAVRNHYGDNRLDTKTAVQEVVEQFGYERMFHVLAVTVKDKDWDARISRDNKAWAETIPVVDGRDGLGYDHNAALVVDKCHPGLTDLFVTAALKEYDRVHSEPEKKNSVRAMLQQEQTAPKPKTAPKKKEPER